VTFAVFIAFLVTSKTTLLWCSAVSRGRKPSPGGALYVSLIFAKMLTCPSSVCSIIPTPNLLALPLYIHVYEIIIIIIFNNNNNYYK